MIRKKTKNHVAALFLPEGVGSNGTESDLFTMSKYPARERYRIQTKPNFALCYTRYSVSGLGNHRTQPKNGGARRDRTDDILLAKQALSQLSYGPIKGAASLKNWWARVDSNYRPHAYQACALTT